MASSERQVRKYGWIDAVMLASILIALASVFLGGLAIIVSSTDFDGQAIVAIVSPALAAVGTVAAGVFGYALGTRGSEEAQRAAGEAVKETALARQEKTVMNEAAGSLARGVTRIVNQALSGTPTPSQKREISEDDLRTLIEAASPVATRAAQP